MGYDEFSTKGADYIARYGLHRKNHISPSVIFDKEEGGVDAVVLEMRGSKVWMHGSVRKTFRKILKGKTQREDFDVVEYCKLRRIPIYITGRERTKRGYILFWVYFMFMLIFIQFTLPLFLILGLVLFYVIPRRKKKKVSKFVSFLMAINFMLSQSMGGAGVNAICAKKTEDYIVPRLRKKLGRRPRIGLNYGLGHIGMRVDFQSKRFREFNLMTLQYMNVEFWKKWGGYRGKIGKVYRAVFDEDIGKWKVRVLETHFFD